MKIVILAAGRGTELGRLTAEIPKCMLSFGNETILGRQIRLWKEAGIASKDIIVVAGYKAKKIVIDSDVEIIENAEYAHWDNAYSLWLALQTFDDDVVVLDGDLIFSLETLKQILLEEGNYLYVAVRDTQYGDTGALIAENGEVLAIGKHIINTKTYAGIMRLRKQDKKLFCEYLFENKTTWYTVAINRALEKICFRAVALKSHVIGVNTYFDYLEAKKQFRGEKFTIWVTGASGFLGQKLYDILRRNFNVVGTSGSPNEEFTAIDLTDGQAVAAFMKLAQPDVVIHTAGIADPEECLRDREKAYRINVKAVEYLLKACREEGKKLIHISTDYVFDGEKKEEYEINDIRKPRNYYGETKVLAEDKVKEYADSLIVRIPILYGYNGHKDKDTFPVKVLRALQKGQDIILDNRQIRYPVLIDDVAFAIQDALDKVGIIHVTSSVPVTKYTWAKLLAQKYGFDSSRIKEDTNCSLQDRPAHVKLKTTSRDYEVSDIRKGTEILLKQCACIFQLIYKSAPVETVYGRNVGKYRYDLGYQLAQSIPAKVINELDNIVPVPTSGLYYAMGLSGGTGIPYVQALYKHDVQARSFQLADIALRERMIEQKIKPIVDLLSGRNILLVDEAIFTGVTLKVVCDMVKACGVKKLYLALPTPICRNQCRQYVQPERRLLSQNFGEDEVKNYFRVEDVFFQEQSVFWESIKNIRNVCADCFCGVEV